MTTAPSARQDDARQPRPLILTLQLDSDAQRRFDRERNEYFPPGRTAVGAHVTLFHALPGSDEPAIADALAFKAAATTTFEVTIGAPVSLGNGVAYPLTSVTLQALHRQLQQLWWPSLTRQDQQGFRAHVTVQNKVTSDVARRTLALLRSQFAPVSCSGRGLELWRYDGGPWTPLATYSFGPAQP